MSDEVLQSCHCEQVSLIALPARVYVVSSMVLTSISAGHTHTQEQLQEQHLTQHACHAHVCQSNAVQQRMTCPIPLQKLYIIKLLLPNCVFCNQNDHPKHNFSTFQGQHMVAHMIQLLVLAVHLLRGSRVLARSNLVRSLGSDTQSARKITAIPELPCSASSKSPLWLW